MSWLLQAVQTSSYELTLRRYQVQLHKFVDVVMKTWERRDGGGVVEAVEGHPVYNRLLSLTYDETNTFKDEDLHDLMYEGCVIRNPKLKVLDSEASHIEYQTRKEKELEEQLCVGFRRSI